MFPVLTLKDTRPLSFHSGYVEYDGVVGRYYKAYVCIWGGGLEVGDARYFYTSAKKATLFAE